MAVPILYRLLGELSPVILFYDLHPIPCSTWFLSQKALRAFVRDHVIYKQRSHEVTTLFLQMNHQSHSPMRW